MKVGLWAFFGFGNLGDAAIQQAVIDSIRRRVPTAEIVAICLDPREVNRRFSIPAYPIYPGPAFQGVQTAVDRGAAASVAAASTSTQETRSRSRQAIDFLKRVAWTRRLVERAWHAKQELLYLRTMHAFLQELDLLVISGSGVLDDTWRGRWKRPFTLFKWCFIARATRTKLIFLSVGATSLNTRLGRFFGKRALELAEYRSFRDEESRSFSHGLASKPDPVMPDLAYSLDVSRYTTRPTPDELTVGIGPIPYYDPRVWPTSDPDVYREYIRKFSAIIEALLGRSCRIRFIAGEMRVDPLAASDMLELLRKAQPFNDAAITQGTISTVHELMGEIAQSDFVITSRFHGVLLPYLLGKPVLALSYNSKIANLMRAAGQQEFCFEIHNFDVTACIAALDALIAGREAIASRLISHRRENNEILQRQYDRFFGAGSASDDT